MLVYYEGLFLRNQCIHRQPYIFYFWLLGGAKSFLEVCTKPKYTYLSANVHQKDKLYFVYKHGLLMKHLEKVWLHHLQHQVDFGYLSLTVRDIVKVNSNWLEENTPCNHSKMISRDSRELYNDDTGHEFSIHFIRFEKSIFGPEFLRWIFF